MYVNRALDAYNTIPLTGMLLNGIKKTP